MSLRKEPIPQELMADSKDSWRERLNSKREPFNAPKKMKQEMQPSEDDITLTHPQNKSTIRIKDSGAILGYAEQELGFMIDPDSKSFNIFADKFNVYSSTTHLRTDEKGFKWNYCPMNPDLQDPFRELVTTRLYGTKLLKRVLNTTGMYANGGGPVAPAGATALMPMIDLKGSKAYDIMMPPDVRKMVNMTKAGGELIKDITSDMSDSIL